MANLVNWAPIVAALGGVGGIATVVRLWSERSDHNKDLTVALNSTARDWVDYIDKKFDAASVELERFKQDQHRRDERLRAAWSAHHAWDVQIKHRLEEATGELVDDPPPIDP